MTAIIKFDQVGISAGVAGDSRDDGLSNGAEVTVTNAGGLACTCRFLDKPIEDSSAVLAQDSPTVWKFSPQSGVSGDYIVQLTETATGTVDEKAFGIPMPNSGLILPGFQSKGSSTVHFSSSAGEKSAAASLSTHNQSVGGRRYTGWWYRLRSLFLKVEELSGSISLNNNATAVKEVIWRPGYAGTNPLVRSTINAALTEALLSPGLAIIRMDPSLSSTFNMPNVALDGQSRVLLIAPSAAGAYTITFGTDDELFAFTGVEVPPNVTLTLSASAAGTNGCFLRYTNEKVMFLLKGDIVTTGAGNRALLKDASPAAVGVNRLIAIKDRSAAMTAGMITMAGNTKICVTGPRSTVSSASGAIGVTSGTPALLLEYADGVGLPASAYSTWPGTVTISIFPSAGYAVAGDQTSTDWPEAVPVTVREGLAKLAARDFVVGSYAVNVQFNRNKTVLVATGAGAVELGIAASGHSTAPVIDVMYWIKANSGITSLSANSAYGQVGNPFINFDPTKGYQVFISRFNFGGSDICYAVSGKVVAA